jgi:hypothetical protein
MRPSVLSSVVRLLAMVPDTGTHLIAKGTKGKRHAPRQDQDLPQLCLPNYVTATGQLVPALMFKR